MATNPAFKGGLSVSVTLSPRSDGGLEVTFPDFPEITLINSNRDYAFEDIGAALQMALVKAGHSWAKPRCQDRAAWLNSAPVGREA